MDRLAQRVILRTSRGPLRHLWWLAYELVARGVAVWLTVGNGRATAYVTRGLGAGRPLYGVSDIDLAVLITADPAGPGRARERMISRQAALRRALPRTLGKVIDLPLVIEAEALAQVSATSVMTFGLAGTDGAVASARGVYFGRSSHSDSVRLGERPGLRGPTADWRRIAGPPRSLPAPSGQRSELRVAAWLELQSWWRWFLQASLRPERPSNAYLCFKVVAEPTRIWLALSGHPVSSRTEALRSATDQLPELATGLRRALELEATLHRGPPAPMAEFLRYFVALSDRIARTVADEVRADGVTLVDLDWGPDEQLALDPRELRKLNALTKTRPPSTLLPLADWRALTRASMRREMAVPEAPDETIAPLALDPSEFSELVAALRLGDRGPYPALSRDALLILASVRWPRTQLRGVHCELTDPVSFALLRGERFASYPNVAGWSVTDTAARAVAEHKAWLSERDPAGDAGREVSMLITAARAALLHESLREGHPRLALTVAGTLRQLRLRQPGSSVVVDAVEEAYPQWRTAGVAPGERIVDALRSLVTQLGPYRR